MALFGLGAAHRNPLTATCVKRRPRLCGPPAQPLSKPTPERELTRFPVSADTLSSMARRRRVPKFRAWVDGVAGSIGDPVYRLRFLKAVAPLAEVREEGRGR